MTENSAVVDPVTVPVELAGDYVVAEPCAPFMLSGPARLTLASLSAGAAVIHFAMVPPHAQEWLPLGVGFALAGWFQLIVSIAIVARPSRRLVQANLFVNAALLGVWAVSRTVGLPIGPDAGHAEAVASVDALCAGLEGLLVIGSVVLLARPKLGETVSIPRFLGGAAIPALAVIALTTAALASPAGTHSHGGSGHGDDHGDELAAAGDHHDDHGATSPTGSGSTDHHDDHDGHGTEASDAGVIGDHDDDHGTGATTSTSGHSDGHAHTTSASGTGGAGGTAEHDDDHSNTSGMDHDSESIDHSHTDATSMDHAHDPGSTGGISDGHAHSTCTAAVTPAQQAAADQLVAATIAAVGPYADFDRAVADGFVPITPPNSPMVHYGNMAAMTDGRVLDPNHIEVLMYAFDSSRTPYFVGAMYMNDTPAIAAPTPGGCATQWHDHTNLCIAPGKGMVGVVDADGSCPAGSSNEVTSQMIHVWTIPLPGGPLSHEASPTEIRDALIEQISGP